MTLLIDILSLAATYAVMASGFVVVYRTSRVLNLAQPGFVLLAGYLAVDLLPDAAGRSANPWVLPFAVVSLLLGGAAVGGLVYWALIRPLAGQSRISLIMMTLAMLFLLQALTQYIWSGANSFIPLPGNQTALELLGSRVRLFDLVAIGLGALVLGLIGVLYSRSRFGIHMRAVAENPALASRRGIDIDRVGAMSWALATSLAVVSALLTGMQSPVSPLLIGATLKGFSVALVGGLDSLAGIAPAALLIALMEVLVIQFVDQQLGQTVPFVVMLAVLMLRPWGLRGTVEELDRV